ncbi:MAG: HEAT repeat domain-containing protein, partial [bacterium]|nr:HEAT repeat domain-containing protein [bacterium]
MRLKIKNVIHTVAAALLLFVTLQASPAAAATTPAPSTKSTPSTTPAERTEATESAEKEKERLIAAYLEELTDKNLCVKTNAIDALGRLKCKKALPRLFGIIRNPAEYMVHSEAIEALRFFNNEDSKKLLMDLILNDTSSNGIFEAKVLKTYNEPRIANALIRALESNKYPSKKKLVNALLIIDPPAALPYHLQTLSEESFQKDYYGKRDYLDSLRNCSTAKSIEVLLGLIDNGEAYGDCFLSNAAWVLGELKAHPAVNMLIDLLQHQKPAVRLSAIEALGKLKAKTATWGNRDTADVFYNILKKDPNRENRETAAAALGHMKDERVLEGLKDPDDSVHDAVYNTFRTFRNKKTMKHLLILFESPGVQKKKKATALLADNPPPGYAGYFIRSLKNSSESITRSMCLRILKQYPRHPDIAAAYFDALEDSNAGVRRTALMALAKYSKPDSLEPILSLMKDRDAKKRILGAFLAKKVRDARILTPLLNLVKDNEFYVRETAIRTLCYYIYKWVSLRVKTCRDEEFADKTKKALSQIKDPAIIRYLLEYLESEEPYKVWKWFNSDAEDILTEIKSQSVVPGLITLLKQGNYSLIPLLGSRGDKRAVEALHEVLNITVDDLEELYKAKEKEPGKRDKYMKKLREGYLKTIRNTLAALAVIGEHGSFLYIKPFLKFPENIIKLQAPDPAGGGEAPFSKKCIVKIQRAAGRALIDLAHPDSVDSIIEFVRKEGLAFEVLLLYIIRTKKAGDVKKILRHIKSPGMLLRIADSCSIDELKSVQIEEKIAPYLPVLRNNKQKKQTPAPPAIPVTEIPALTWEDGCSIYKDRTARSYVWKLGRDFNTIALVELIARLRLPGW